MSVNWLLDLIEIRYKQRGFFISMKILSLILFDLVILVFRTLGMVTRWKFLKRKYLDLNQKVSMADKHSIQKLSIYT